MDETTYIAKERLQIGGETRLPGDRLPEVKDWDWRVRENYIRAGRIAEVTVLVVEAAEPTPKGKK